MSQKLGTIKNAETGEVLVEMIGPANAASNGDALSVGLYALSELVIRAFKPESRFGGMGGEFGYACEFENDVFEIQPDYQHCSCPYSEDDSDSFLGPNQIHVPDCFFVIDKPNFRHKASGLEVRWYKWIGRDMEISNPDLTGEEWHKILMECYYSIPQDVREKAEAESKADAKREADPEYQRQRQEGFNALMRALDEIRDQCEREGHDDPGGHCRRCGLVTDVQKHLECARNLDKERG